MVAGKRCQEPWQQEHLGLRLFHPPVASADDAFDGVDKEEGYTKLHTFGMCNGMPFSDFSREFRVLVPTATGSEHALSPGKDMVLEVVRVAANKQFPPLLPALYPASKATDPRPYASLDAMWGAFSD